MKRTLIAGLALAAIAAPSFAEEDYHPSWNLYVQDDIATLSYAIPESDDSGPTFYCDREGGRNTHPGQIEAYFFTEHSLRGRTAPLRLTSGTVTVTLTARVETNEESGGSELHAQVPVAAPILAQFARTGRIVFAAGGETNSPPVAPVAKVARLIATCRR